MASMACRCRQADHRSRLPACECLWAAHFSAITKLELIIATSRSSCAPIYQKFTNVVFSTLFSHASKGDACTAYFLSIFVDCTLGVLIIYSTLRIFSYVLVQRLHLKGYRSGQYYEKHGQTSTPYENGADGADNDIVFQAGQGNGRDSLEDGRKPAQTASDLQSISEPHFQFSWWGKQLMVYLASLVVMKLAILGFFWIPAVLAIGDWMLSWLGEDTKIVFVLMIFPLAMNALQFLLIDTILKSKTPFLEESLVGERPGSTHSARNSEDRPYRIRDEEEGRAFLLHDSTHDELDPGARDATPLPSYYEPSSSLQTAGKLDRQEFSSSGHRSEPQVDTKQEWSSFDVEDDDYSTTPRPASQAQVKAVSPAESLGKDAQHGSAIPLRIVPPHRRQPSQSPVSEHGQNDVGGGSEANGWDWLSDAGSTSRQNEEETEQASPEIGAAFTTNMLDAPLKAKNAKLD